MANQSSSRGNSNLVLGFCIILVGVVILLDNLDLINSWDVFRFWPAVFVLIGIFKITNAVSPTGRAIGLIFIVFGGLLLVDKLYFFHFDFGDWWPLILIIIGAGMLINRTSGCPPTSADPQSGDGRTVTDATINLFALMGGYKRVCGSQNFRGGDVNAIMGGCEVDLRQASIQNQPAVINVFAFWGGIEIKVPPDWKVIVEGFPVLGGIGDNTVSPSGDDGKQLIIRGQAIMGGVEIKN
jgi:predicted membrane protein